MFRVRDDPPPHEESVVGLAFYPGIAQPGDPLPRLKHHHPIAPRGGAGRHYAPAGSAADHADVRDILGVSLGSNGTDSRERVRGVFRQRRRLVVETLPQGVRRARRGSREVDPPARRLTAWNPLRLTPSRLRDHARRYLSRSAGSSRVKRTGRPESKKLIARLSTAPSRVSNSARSAPGSPSTISATSRSTPTVLAAG